ncbi:MAG: hypothetical protein RL404_1194 [Pseudomonadota bacterium]
MEMSMKDLHTDDATTLARKLARREVTAEAVLMSCLDRIDEREPEVQAWAHLDKEGALARARELDNGPVRGLLHGLPVGVKDLFDTADMPTTYGSPIYAGHRPAADAAPVALCREQGAVMVGKTVTTEFATFNPGKTRNPHRLTHTPGGSSSGSAAAVADGMVPLAFASQTAASVIRPAAFCGIVGYKPSYGLVNRSGVKPLSDSLDTIGFLARSVDDAALFAAATTGDRSLLQLDVGGTPRIAMCATHEWPLADVDTRLAMQQAAMRLAQAGVPVRDVQTPMLFSQLLQVQKEIMAYELARSLSHERLRHAGQLSDKLQALLDEGMRIAPERHWANIQLAYSARAKVSSAFGDSEAWLAPSAIGEAPATLEQTGDPVFGRIWTLLGLPCVHLPFTTGQSGMPVGLQLVGRYGDDRVVLRIARWLMQHLAAKS